MIFCPRGVPIEIDLVSAVSGRRQLGWGLDVVLEVVSTLLIVLYCHGERKGHMPRIEFLLSFLHESAGENNIHFSYERDTGIKI